MIFFQRIVASLLVLILLCGIASCETSRTSSLSSEEPKAQQESRADTIHVDYVGSLTLEELFARFMNDRLYGNEVGSYTRAVLQTGYPGAADSVITYINNRLTWWGSAINQLARAKRPELGPWLRENADELETGHWSDIGSALAHNGWRDSVVAEVLMEQVCCNEDKRSRSASARAFVGMGTVEEIRVIAAIGDTSSWKSMRWTAISAQARFDVPEFNEHVRQALRDTSRLNLRILEGVELNRRHDFLPELRATLRKYRDGDPDHHLIDNLEEMITEFEATKAEGIEPGAPLDYPNSTRPDSTSR